MDLRKQTMPWSHLPRKRTGNEGHRKTGREREKERRGNGEEERER